MTQLYRIGMVGLGVMGRNFVLNMADHGFSVCGYDKNPEPGALLLKEGAGKKLACAPDVKSFLAMLEKPRVIVILVAPAHVVDFVLTDFLPHVEPGRLRGRQVDAFNPIFSSHHHHRIHDGVEGRLPNALRMRDGVEQALELFQREGRVRWNGFFGLFHDSPN